MSQLPQELKDAKLPSIPDTCRRGGSASPV